MPLSIVRNNITDMHVDAIVNTANPLPIVGSGVDTAVHQAAGPALLEAREKIGLIPRGYSAVTPAFNLPAKYVIHTVGPVWEDGEQGEEATLRSCYDTALKLAAENGCESVAFPLISAGNYGFPKALALQTAISAISAFLMKNEDILVHLVVFDRSAYALSEKLFTDVKTYIDEHLVEEIRAAEYKANVPRNEIWEDELPGWARESRFLRENRRLREESRYDLSETDECCSTSVKKKELSLEDLIFRPEESFSAALLRMIGERGLKNSEVYKKANMDKKHFSKILKETYQPGKNAVMALAIALELNLDETRDFLGRAGYALSRSSQTDIIVQYFIENGNYNMFELEGVLYEFTGKTLMNY